MSLPLASAAAQSTTRAFVLTEIVQTVLELTVFVFWMYIAWRAMRAHERLPDALARRLEGPAAPE